MVALTIPLLRTTLEGGNLAEESDAAALVDAAIRTALLTEHPKALRFADMEAPTSVCLSHQCRILEHARRVLRTSRETTWRGANRVTATSALEAHKAARCEYCTIAPRCGTKSRLCVTASHQENGITLATGVIRTPSPRPREADQVRAFKLELTPGHSIKKSSTQCKPQPDIYPTIEPSGVCLGDIQSWEPSLTRVVGMRAVVNAFDLQGNPLKNFATVNEPLKGSSAITLRFVDTITKLAVGAFNGVTVEVTVHRKRGATLIRRCFTIANETDGPWKSWALPLKLHADDQKCAPVVWIPDPTHELELAVYRTASLETYLHGHILRPVWAGLIRRARQLA